MHCVNSSHSTSSPDWVFRRLPTPSSSSRRVPSTLFASDNPGIPCSDLYSDSKYLSFHVGISCSSSFCLYTLHNGLAGMNHDLEVQA